MRRLMPTIAVLAAFLLLVTAGCYTVLRHPTGRGVIQEGSYYRSCSDCHADAAYYHPYYSYGRSHYRWSGYYGYPWWYDDYWWWDPYYGDDDEGPEVERGTRHMWSPDGWPSGGWGFTKSGNPPSAPAPPSGSETFKPETKKEKKEKDKDDESDKDEDTQHLWKKKKKGF